MADNMQGLKRTHYCGDVESIGSEVVVGGFVQKVNFVNNKKADEDVTFGNMQSRITMTVKL